MWLIIAAVLVAQPPVKAKGQIDRMIENKQWFHTRKDMPQTPTTFPRNLTMPIPAENKNP